MRVVRFSLFHSLHFLLFRWAETMKMAARAELPTVASEASTASAAASDDKEKEAVLELLQEKKN